MVYIFMERGSAGTAQEVARVAVGDDGPDWSGQKAEQLRQWLIATEWPMLDAKFDEKNQEHWETLPSLVHGARLWVGEG